jgi:hypothetical protein
VLGYIGKEFSLLIQVTEERQVSDRGIFESCQLMVLPIGIRCPDVARLLRFVRPHQAHQCAVSKGPGWDLDVTDRRAS